MRIRPENDMDSLLLQVASPARYVGGEYGSIHRDREDSLKVALSFPDLYEIGMSNLAVRLLYNVMNGIEGVQCERVFAPAQDFEERIRERSIPLYTLESGIPLSECDVIGFSVGYELAFTSLLSVLETGQVPLFADRRSGSDPIVIAGGPAITNPAPFGPFLDAVIIGEAEPVVRELFPRLVSAKRRGAAREDLLAIVREHPSAWYRGRSGAAVRAIDREFSAGMAGTLLPMPSIRTVQDQGVIEIMRGCPNGCRFCHAGIYYRPMRMKSHETIGAEADRLVGECGYREITLSSLSTGDYAGISELVRGLNRRFADRKVSFSLPSLRISSFTLPLLAEVSAVRKSGLTFAVETPNPAWQRGINKSVDIDRTVEILRQAMSLGWNSAKFYFMLGLPVCGGEDESDAIVAFLREVQDRTRIRMNINVGTFIPKPHTPFQWAAQLPEKEALRRIYRIKDGLRGGSFKLGYHSPFLSLLEGILSRGDERAGLLAYEVYRNGGRLDAWEEHLKWDLWREAIERSEWDVESETCRERDPEETLPWDGVNLGIGKGFLRNEYRKALDAVLTDPCADPCDHSCGVCSGDRKIEPAVSRAEPETGIPAPDDSPLDVPGEEVEDALFVSTGREEQVSRSSRSDDGVRACAPPGGDSVLLYRRIQPEAPSRVRTSAGARDFVGRGNRLRHCMEKHTTSSIYRCDKPGSAGWASRGSGAPSPAARRGRAPAQPDVAVPGIRLPDRNRRTGRRRGRV